MKIIKRIALFILVMSLFEILIAPRDLAWGCTPWPGDGTNTESDGTNGDTERSDAQDENGPNCPTNQEPVRLNSGNYIREKTLLSLPSRGMSTVITAYYNSQEIVPGPMGEGWSHSFETYIIPDSNHARVILWGDGRRDTYRPKESGGFVSPPGTHNTLTEDPNGYTLMTKYGTEYRFSKRASICACLSYIRDRNQNTINLHYDPDGRLVSLSDTVERGFTFTYTGERLTSIEDPTGRSVTFSYNQEGLLTSITDPMGNVTHYGYNEQKKIASITDAKGQKYFEQTYDDDDFPRVVSQNYGGQKFNLEYDFRESTARETTNGKTTNYEYSYDTGFQTRIMDPLGNETATIYDEAGYLTCLLDAKSHGTNFFYDAKGNCIRIEQPDNIVTTFTYEPDFSQVTSATDPNGNTSTFTYDSKGNRLTTTNPLGETSSFSYDKHGQLTSVTDASGYTTTFSYDMTGNLTSVCDPLQNTWTFGYDERGNRVSAQDPLNHATFTTYNLNNQTRAVKDPMDHITSFSYDKNGKLSSVTDANGNTISYEYTALDMISRVTDSMNQSISYSYNQDGLLSSITNARGNTTSFAYDELERLIQTEDPLGRTTSVCYDEVGNVTSRTDGKGSTTVYWYDDINRLTRRTFGDKSTVEYQYDLGGRKTLLKDRDGNATTYRYNAANRLISVVTRGRSVNYGYDTVGNVLSVENPEGGQTTNYAYDAGNRLLQVSNNGKIFSFQYDAAGRLTNRLYPNGIVTNYSYNECNWLTLLAHVQQNSFLSFQYTYDNIGNRTSKTVTDAQGQHVWGYTYDALYRLATETYPDTHDVVYMYDPNGNRLSRAENGESINSVYDAADQLLSSGVISCHWDGNGNLIRKSEGNATTNYAYDPENHLAQITLPDGTMESYGYNGDGLRVSKTRRGIDTNYLLSGSDVLKEETSGQGGPPSTYYILGGSMAGPLALKQPSQSDSVYHFPLTDAQGSVMMLTDENANMTDAYAFDAFGSALTLQDSPPNTTYNPYRYTGQQTDDSTGLTYLRARYYDPQVGRFITSDPIGFSAGPNFYAYCGNNPVVFVDPWGREILVVSFQFSTSLTRIIGATFSITYYIDTATGDYISVVSGGPSFGPGFGGVVSAQVGLSDTSSLADASRGNVHPNVNVDISGFAAATLGPAFTIAGTPSNQAGTIGLASGVGAGIGATVDFILGRTSGNIIANMQNLLQTLLKEAKK
ncbi:MAG: RHS repeat-associated core domain-containing protein [bacterium]